MVAFPTSHAILKNIKPHKNTYSEYLITIGDHLKKGLLDLCMIRRIALILLEWKNCGFNSYNSVP